MKGTLEDYLKEGQEDLIESHDIICTLPNVVRMPYKTGNSLEVALNLNSFEKSRDSPREIGYLYVFPVSAAIWYANAGLVWGVSPLFSLVSAVGGTICMAGWLRLEAVKSRIYSHKIASLLFSGEGRKAIGEVAGEHNEKSRQMFEEDMPFAEKQHILEINDSLHLQQVEESFIIDTDIKKWNEKFGKTDEEWVKAMAGEIYSFLGCDYGLPATQRNKEIRRANYVEAGAGLIRIPENRSGCGIPSTIAHELAHHCQKPSKKWRPRAVEEGFASAIEIIAVESYATKAGDNYTRWGNLCFANRALNAAKQMQKGEYQFSSEDTIVYHVGMAAFLAAEKMHGRGIYKEVLNAEKPAKLLVDMIRGGR